MHLPIGTRLQGGKYEIVRYISSGGFGCTYEARNTAFRNKVKTVAIKEFFVKDFCNRNEETNEIQVATKSKMQLVERLRSKFSDEAEALYEMNHPNIVRVTDKFEENGTAYYVMDYIEGSSLSQLISEKGHLSESEALGYIRQVADALRYVHSHNRLHLDVKPHNIMVESSGRAILIDFGVSKQYDEVNGENTSTLLGCTPGYAPIEQGSRGLTEFHAATDIYALGATLYKALSGITPVEATLRASGMKLQPLPGSLSPSTASAIEKSMQLIVDNRPQSVDEFLEIVERGKSKDERAKIINEKEERKDESEETVYPVSVVSAADDETIAPGSSKETPRDAARSSSAYSSSNEKENKTTPAKRKSKLPLIAALLLCLVLCIGAMLMFGGGNEDTVVAEAETPVPTPPVTDSNVVANKTNQARLERERNTFKTRTFTVNGVNFKMVAVEGGTFQMGATNEQQNAYSDEKPVHSVTLSDYYIGETEVTQELWQAVMGNNPASFKGDDQRPVECVSWNDCQIFIMKLNDHLAGQLPAGRKFRLPTEAQWEYAARGGNKSEKYQYSGSNYIGTVAWYDENSKSTTHPVGKKSPNELGLYDMSGNVWEWCSDSYGSYTRSSQTNPEVTSKDPGSNRVLRGGSWNGGAQGCRVAFRYNISPAYSFRFNGLRLAF